MWNMVLLPDTSGPLNYLLTQLGIISQPINWLNNFSWALPTIILVGIWGGLPQSSVVLLAGLQSIPKELYEAAGLDGAGVWAQFRHVTLPGLRQVIVAIVSLRFMWNFNAFGLVYALTQGGPGGRTRLPMLFAYEEGFRYGNAGYAAALGNVMVLVVSAFIIYLRSSLQKKVGCEDEAQSQLWTAKTAMYAALLATLCSAFSLVWLLSTTSNQTARFTPAGRP